MLEDRVLSNKKPTLSLPNEHTLKFHSPTCFPILLLIIRMNEGNAYFHWKPLWEAMNAHGHSCLRLVLRLSAGSVQDTLLAPKHIPEKRHFIIKVKVIEVVCTPFVKPKLQSFQGWSQSKAGVWKEEHWKREGCFWSCRKSTQLGGCSSNIPSILHKMSMEFTSAHLWLETKRDPFCLFSFWPYGINSWLYNCSTISLHQPRRAMCDQEPYM